MNVMGKRVIAVLVLAALVLPVSALVCNDAEYSSAADADYGKFYYNQLTELEKAIYDAVDSASPESLDITVTYNESMLDDPLYSDMDTKGKKFSMASSRAFCALRFDNPSIYWYEKYSIPKMEISQTEMKFTLETVSHESKGLEKLDTDKSLKDSTTSINLAMDSMTVDTTSRYTTVKSIYEGVIGMLSYDSSDSTGTGDNRYLCRSMYTALCSTDHKVVCEGYAKTFKAMCDKYNVPCIIISGDAFAEGSWEGHMYNYVKMADEKWYLVDATWGDQTSVDFTYFLAGNNTMGFNERTVGYTHKTNTTTDPYTVSDGYTISYGFSLANAPLQDEKYSAKDEDFKQYTITFDSDGGSEVAPIKVVENTTATKPADPVKPGYKFQYWYSVSKDQPWDWKNVVNADATLKAYWKDSSIVTYTVEFDPNGADGKTTSLYVDSDANTIKIPTMNKQREGYTFSGWCTSADGKGLTYQEGETITVNGDVTFYAKWTSTSDTSPMGIDSAIGQAGEFLSGELIPGLSNTTLVIIIITAVVGLLAILIISRK